MTCRLRRRAPFPLDQVPSRGHGRVLHGRGVRGIVRRIVQSGAQIWPRQPLPAARPTVAGAASRGDAGIALWLARLEDFDLDTCAAALDAADAARAAAIADPGARRRAIVSRGLLRRVIASRLGARPEALRIVTVGLGRPALEGDGAGDPPLQFNLSHAGGWWLCATAEGPVGVDLEMAGRKVDAARLAGRVFTPGEQAALQLAPPAKPVPSGFHVGPGPGDTLVPTPGQPVAALRVRSLALPIAAHAAIACAPSVAHFGRAWLQGDEA